MIKTHLFETSAASSLLSQEEWSEACCSDTLLVAMTKRHAREEYENEN